jgi:hypothetical protein
MREKLCQICLIGPVTAHIALSVFKDADQTDIVIIPGQPRLYILKITHMYGDIVTFPVPVSIDQAALFRQFHTVHSPCLPGERPCDGAAAAPHF